MDEDLLRALEVKLEVREIGGSAVFRASVREHPRREQHPPIDEHYARVYGGRGGTRAEVTVREK